MRKQTPKLTPHEQRIVDLLHEARATTRAPASLRARIEAARPPRVTRVRRGIAYGGALTTALAAAALVLLLVLPAGSPGGPSLSQAAALALRGPASPPPSPDPSAPTVKLLRDIEGLYFPNWLPRFGWRASGQRADSISSRRAVTVFYASHGHQVAYTIVAAPALQTPAAATTWRAGTELKTLTLNGRLTVTWHRAGHTCILSATGVSADEMRALAAWKVPGEIR